MAMMRAAKLFGAKDTRIVEVERPTPGPGEILVSEGFKAALKTPPRMKPMPPMELKNKSQPVKVYTVVR